MCFSGCKENKRFFINRNFNKIFNFLSVEIKYLCLA